MQYCFYGCSAYVHKWLLFSRNFLEDSLTLKILEPDFDQI